MLKEFYNHKYEYANFLCPDIASFDLHTTQWLEGVKNRTTFAIQVKAKDGTDAYMKKATQIVMNWIYPYFNQDVEEDANEQFSYASSRYETTYLDYTETPLLT